MKTVNYGFDAPGIMRNLLISGCSLIIVGLGILSRSENPVLKYGSYILILTGIVLLTLGIAMFLYGIKGKFRMRDFMLQKVNWIGNETVLDIGTGRGLFLVGAAKYLTTGKSIGIDIWNKQDLSGNTIENAYRNAELENVRHKVDIKNEDARTMSFADNSFDVIFSMLCLHNIDGKAEQEKACFEIARVLKPNGTALIGDYVPTHDYAEYFAKAGLTVKSSKQYLSTAYALMWMVEATKQ